MRVKFLFGLLPLIVFFLSGCVHHLSQQECLSTNWYQVGFNDASNGNQQRDLTQSIQDCAKFKLTVDTAAYHNGWLAGLKQYCTPTSEMGLIDGQAGKSMQDILSRQSLCQSGGLVLNTVAYKKGYTQGLARFCTYDDGYNIGIQGHQPPDVCPAEYKGRFMAGWQAGTDKYCRQANVGFSLGKSGAPYPSACNPVYYLSFKTEYDRGLVVFQRIQTLQGQISSIDDQVNHLVFKYRLEQGFDGTYHLGKRKDDEARDGLHRVQMMLYQKSQIQNQLFQAQAMG